MKRALIWPIFLIVVVGTLVAFVVGCTSKTSGDEGSGLPGPGQVRELVRDVTGVYALDLSVDGSKLLYITFQDPANDKIDLVVRDARTGEALHSLGSTSITAAAWGPDSSTIAYLTYTNSKQNEAVGLLPTDTWRPQPLVDPVAYDIMSTPAWSSDGKLLAFWSRKYLDQKTAESTLWTVRPDGSDLKKLYGGPGAQTASLLTGALAWSPDNSKLLFSMSNGETVNAYVLGQQGGSPKNLTPDQFKVSDLFWSPTGERIAYAAVDKADPSGTPRVWLMKADSSGKEALGPFGRPVGWIPSSGELVYIASDKDATWPASRLEALDVKTKAIRQLAAAKEANIVAATVSGDNRLFYVTADREGEGSIFVIE